VVEGELLLSGRSAWAQKAIRRGRTSPAVAGPIGYRQLIYASANNILVRLVKNAAVLL